MFVRIVLAHKRVIVKIMLDHKRVFVRIVLAHNKSDRQESVGS